MYHGQQLPSFALEIGSRMLITLRRGSYFREDELMFEDVFHLKDSPPSLKEKGLVEQNQGNQVAYQHLTTT